MKFPFRKPEEPKPGITFWEAKSRMADAITKVLTGAVSERSGAEFYDELTDDEMYAFSQTLWEYHGDLRDEWARRKMQDEIEKREKEL